MATISSSSSSSSRSRTNHAGCHLIITTNPFSSNYHRVPKEVLLLLPPRLKGRRRMVVGSNRMVVMRMKPRGVGRAAKGIVLR